MIDNECSTSRQVWSHRICQRVRHCPHLLGILASLIAASASTHAAEFIPLGHLETGATQSWAVGISADGSVAVGTSVSATGQEQAFRWDVSSGMAGLGDLAGGIFESNAFAASLAGHRAVGASKSGPQSEAFLWSEDEGMVGLGGLGGVPTFSMARNVSDSGAEIVGFSYNISGNPEAFLWTDADGMVGLGDLPGGVSNSDATAVSANGSVVVGGSVSGNGPEAFRWTLMTGMVPLGDLTGGTFSSTARDVSGNGIVVVGDSNSAAGTEAFRWTETDGMVGLGDLEGGDFYSKAEAASFDGSRVVGISSSELGLQAFLWDAQHGMRTIEDILSDSGIDTSGWRLVGASGISADGSTIVGRGFNPQGIPEAWLARVAEVPEPSSWALLVGASLAFAFYRSRLSKEHGKLARAMSPCSKITPIVVLLIIVVAGGTAMAKRPGNSGGHGDPPITTPAVAFVTDDRGKGSAVMIATADLANEISVTRDLVPDDKTTYRNYGSPAWSSNGQALAFWAQDVLSGGTHSEMMLYQASADGQNVTLLRDFNTRFSFDAPGFVSVGLNWSDSGRELLYGGIAIDVENGDTRVLLDGTTGVPSSQPALTIDLDAAPGYQGYLAAELGGDIFVAPISDDPNGYLISPNADQFTNVTSSPDSNQYHPSWSPDGTQLAIFDAGDLSILDMGSGVVTSLPGGFLSHISAAERATWTSDGTSLLYHSAQIGWTDIAMISASGNDDPVNFTDTRNRTERTPTWNPVWESSITATETSGFTQAALSVPEPSAWTMIFGSFAVIITYSLRTRRQDHE